MGRERQRASAYVRWWEGWKSSDMEASGERTSGGTKQERKASRKEAPLPAPLTERSEADDAVVATEARDSSPLPPGSLRLQGEAPPLPLLILEPRVGSARAALSRLRSRAETKGRWWPSLPALMAGNWKAAG